MNRQGLDHYIIFVVKYNYNYFLKKVVKYQNSTTFENFKCNEYTTTIPLLLYNLVVFFENVNNPDFTKSLPILDTCSIAMNFAKKSD